MRARVCASSGTSGCAKGPRHSTILSRHLHWDHVAGLPFFTPIYVPGHRVEIASGPNGVMPHDDAIRSLFRAPFFPVDYAQLSDQMSTRELRPNEKFTIGDITVTMAKLNHPDPVYGFRLEHGGQSIVYATDTEHFACVDPTLQEARGRRGHPDLRRAVHARGVSDARSAGVTRRGSRAQSSRARRVCRSSCCSTTTRIAPTHSSRRSRPQARGELPGHRRGA